MTRNEKRDMNKEKNIECPRFKKHIKNKKSGNDEKENDKSGHDKSKGSVSAVSSNLSRNVITNIDPKQSAYVVKRRGAILNTKKASPAPVNCLKDSETDGSGLHNNNTNTQPFEAGPPPTLNSLHRLNKKVSDAKADLDKFNSNSDIVGLQLAEEKLVDSPRSNNNFRKTVSKRVDISPEEQLYSSLANLSMSSTSMDSRIDRAPHSLCVASESRKGRDPEPKLEWFHQPYTGTEVLVHASDDMIQTLLDESYKLQREILISTPITAEYKISDY